MEGDFLPMPPKEGPLLPKKMGITWSVLWTIVTLPYQIVKAAKKTDTVIKGSGEARWRE